MDRRAFMSAMGTGLIVPLVATSQPATAMPRIGMLSPVSPRTPPSINHEAFREGLRALGYVDGKTVAIEFRSAEGHPERLPALAAELVALKVDVIVTNGEQAIRAARGATTAIPIVMAVVGDPVIPGFVASLARPGGNITGLTNMASGLDRKRLELLKEALPRASRVAVLRYPPEGALDAWYWREVQSAAKPLAIKLISVEVVGRDDFAKGFAAMQTEGADALIVMASTFFFANRAMIVESAVRSRIPGVFENRAFVEAGGLMSYGPDLADLWRRAATYVDRILKGARPTDMPVQLPTTFELIFNLKTAKSLGVAIPQSLLLRADEVIQ